jgi:hypothetical protein
MMFETEASWHFLVKKLIIRYITCILRIVENYEPNVRYPTSKNSLQILPKPCKLLKLLHVLTINSQHLVLNQGPMEREPNNIQYSKPSTDECVTVERE